MGFASGFFKPSSSGGSQSLSTTALSAGYEKTILVTKSGNNSGANGTANKPFLTIQAALDYASATYPNFSDSVIIVVGPGDYSENITISRHNTYITSQLSRPDQRAVKIVGTVIVACSTANSKYNQIVGLQGLFISNSTTSPSVKITGNAEHLTYIKDCYIAQNNTNSAANCLFLDSTLTFDKSRIMIENSTFLNQKAGPEVIKVSGGDVGLDSIRIITSSITGAGTGILQNGNSIILADRIQIDITTNGKCIDTQSTNNNLPDAPKFYLSNSSLTVRGSSSAEVIYTSRGIFLWNCILTGVSTATVKGVGSSYITYNNLVSGVLGGSGPVAPTLDFASAAQKIKFLAA